ncbi:MAG: bifunctional DNA-formamidopyrimidine glycosylase/DNA-(apurinic or apyrimidinic site) lyase [Terriglobales bacterium]
MPELPEVETIARGLRARMVGARVAAATLLRASVFHGELEALAELRGGTIAGVERGGKYLVIRVRRAGRDWQLMVHLGMSGQLLLGPADAPPLRHTHFTLELEDGRMLRFRDPRRFGRLALAAAPAAGFAAALGVAAGAEPLEVEAAEFVRLFSKRSAPIKNALMNQRLLRGLGNIYADESLHRAGLDPRARTVSGARLRQLRLAIRAVLTEAIAAGGSSISDYVASDGEPGSFHVQHRVYGLSGEPCRRCRSPIRRIVLAGRSAHFCPRCQRR